MTVGVLEQRMTTSPEAARAYRAGVDALLQVRHGSLQLFARALALDPTFALAHAALALIGHENGAPVDVRTRITMAQLHGRRASESERSHIGAIAEHVGGDRTALVRHLRDFPGDAVLLGVAVPSFAFAGVTEEPAQAWQIVESCTPAQSGTWFHDGLLAFALAQQGRYDDAMDLAARSMTCVPGAGHAAHARAQVHYETGDHQAGLDWLDAWMDGAGHDTQHRAHFSWHAALHELGLGDLEAVSRRYRTQLSGVLR